MPDNEAKITFILQDEGGGGAPGGEGAATPGGGVTRPKTTEARAKASGDRADAIIADRVPALVKQTKGETATKIGGESVRAVSDSKLATKIGGAASCRPEVGARGRAGCSRGPAPRSAAGAPSSIRAAMGRRGGPLAGPGS